MTARIFMAVDTREPGSFPATEPDHCEGFGRDAEDARINSISATAVPTGAMKVGPAICQQWHGALGGGERM